MLDTVYINITITPCITNLVDVKVALGLERRAWLYLHMPVWMCNNQCPKMQEKQ
jgi:hypothetical protein